MASLVAVMLIGCQSAGSRPSLEDTLQNMQLRLGEEQTGLSSFTINGFQAIDDLHLIVNSGTQTQHLIELATPCLELPYALSVGFERRSTNISNFDSIVVNSQGRPSQRCRISRILRLESIEAP